MRPFLIALSLLFAPLLAVPGSDAQSLPDSKPQEVSLCDLLKNPKKYDHAKLLLRGAISSEFEDFTIFDKSCTWPDWPGIWLMFGGDVDCPTPSTWNDVGRPKGKDVMFDGVRYPLVKDGNFRNFYGLVTTRKSKKAVYHAKATLEGTFFSGATYEGEKPSKPPMPGFGHLGCCHLFIIHQVIEVEAQKN